MKINGYERILYLVGIISPNQPQQSMKQLRIILLSLLTCFGILTATVYTSCSTADKCSVSCMHGGICHKSTCQCSLTYTGTNCEARNIIGNWKGTDLTSSPASVVSQTINIAVSGTDSSVASITFYEGIASGHTITGTIDTSNAFISYKKQVIYVSGGDIDTLSGTIAFNGFNAISNLYTATTTYVHHVNDIQGTYTKY